VAQVASWNWWTSLAGAIFGGSIGGASKKDKIARQGAILQESWKPCPAGYYAAKYSGPNKNTVQCWIDPNYVAPPLADPDPLPPDTPATPSVPDTPPVTPTVPPPADPAPSPLPSAPRPGDTPLIASPGALDWDPRAYRADNYSRGGTGDIHPWFQGKQPTLAEFEKAVQVCIRAGGDPDYCRQAASDSYRNPDMFAAGGALITTGAKVKRITSGQIKMTEALRQTRLEGVFRDPLIKPRTMPRVDLPKGRTLPKITALGAAARAGSIIGLILTPGRLGNSDLYRDPYPAGQPVRTNRAARDSSNRGQPISAANKARLERIGVIPRSTANRAASKLPPTVELQPIAITARRTAVAAPVPKANPRPTTARTPVARAPAAAPTPAWKRLITLPKVDWTSLIIGLATKPRDRVSAVTLPLYLSTPTPTPTPTPTSTPTTAPKDDPLTAPTVDPLGSPAGPGYTPPYSTRTSECDCKPKKRKPAKPRTECYKGSYVEKARGLTKTKREKVPCQ